jgi:hypothetical protein
LCEITADGRDLVAKATDAVTAIDLGITGLTERELDQLTRLVGKLRLASGDYEA